MDTNIYIMLLTIKKSESLKFMFTLWVKYFNSQLLFLLIKHTLSISFTT